MGGVTPAGRRLAAFGVNALNGGDFGERSAAGVTDNVEQQPGDIGGIRSVFTSCRLGGDFAAVGQFPGRSGAMMPDILAVRVGEIRVRSLQGPGELLVATRLANVNLGAGSVRDQHDLFIHRGGDLGRNLRASEVLRRDRAGGEQQKHRGREQHHWDFMARESSMMARRDCVRLKGCMQRVARISPETQAC